MRWQEGEKTAADGEDGFGPGSVCVRWWDSQLRGRKGASAAEVGKNIASSITQKCKCTPQPCMSVCVCLHLLDYFCVSLQVCVYVAS